MNRKHFCHNNLRANLCVLTLGLALGLSCQSSAERDKQLLAADTKASAQLQQINVELNTARRISPENFDALKSLRARYPKAADLTQSYKAALSFREDWGELANILNETPAAARTREDSVLLAKVYIKLGKFAESSATLRALGLSDDPEYRSLSALAHFSQGELSEAAADLDAVWNNLLIQKRIDDINLRGLIYFRTGENDKAIATLAKSLEIEPLNPVATNTLSRVYAAMGDVEKAESYRLETVKAWDRSTLDENSKLRFASLRQQLEAAWSSKRFNDVLTIAKQMLEMSDEGNRDVIQKYIAGAESELRKRNLQ